MSLIQEALKRKDDENSSIPPKAIPIIPPTARAMQVNEADAPKKLSFAPAAKPTTRGGWPFLVISLLVVTVIAFAAIGLLVYSARSLARGGSQTQTAAGAAETSAPQAAVPEVVPVPPPTVQSVAAAPAPVLTPVKPVAEAAPALVASTPTAAAPVVLSISTGVVKGGVTQKKPALSEVSVVPVSKPVSSQSMWPTLKVVGVMTPRSANQMGAAIIDGNLVECGDEIRGVKVHAVDKLGVWFEFNKQTQFVRVGQTTL